MVTSLVVLTTLVSMVTGQLTWQRIHDGTAGPVARRDAALGYDMSGHQLVLYGGRRSRGDGFQVLDDTWLFDLNQGTVHHLIILLSLYTMYYSHR